VRLQISRLYRAACISLFILTLPTLALAYDVRLNVPFKSQVPPPTSDKWPINKKGIKVWPATKNCGQTCVLMVSSYYKQTTPTEQDIKAIDDWLFQKFQDPVNGYLGTVTNTAKLATLATQFAGFADVATHSNWTLDDLKNELNQGFPVIVAVWTDMSVGSPHEQHFMVLVGMDDNFVYFNDPGKTNGKNNKYSIAQFLKAWQNQHSAVVTIHGQISVSCRPSGLVSWWPGEGHANDILGGNHGTLQNGASFAAGEVGQAFSLDGVAAFINVPDASSLDAITSAMSVEGWINPDTPNNPRSYIFARRDPNVSESFSVVVYSDGKIGLIIRTVDIGANGITFVTAPGVIHFNQWQHIAATFVGSTGKANIYVNGQAQTISVFEGPNSSSGALAGVRNLFIGRRQDISDAGEGAPGASYYKGLIDEISLYNRALTGSEVQTIFNAGSAGKCKTGTFNVVELLPYQAANYRYLVVNQGATPPAGYEQPSFNDSAWNVGTAAFGFSTNRCLLPKSARTLWPVNTHLLVRRIVSIPAGATNVRVMIAVDNDIVDVFFNGERMSTPLTIDGCPNLDGIHIDVQQSLVKTGDNVVAYHVSDRGDETFFDTRILGNLP
jgi:predicted double-glycine peptidase